MDKTVGGMINMKEIWGYSQMVLAAVGGYLGWLLGGGDGFLYVLVACVVLDYVTGVMLAILQRKLSSDIGFKGIFKKILIFTMVAIGNIIDSHIIKDGSAIRTAVLFFYISNEGISIIENSAKIGLPVPKKLRDVLEQLGKEDEKNDQ